MQDGILQLQFGSEIFDLSSIGMMEGSALVSDGGGEWGFAPHRLDSVLQSEALQLTEEHLQVAFWGVRGPDIRRMLTRLWRILRGAWRYTFTSRQDVPVYLVFMPKSGTAPQYALLHSCPQVSGPSPIGAVNVDRFFRVLLEEGLTLLHFPWTDGPPGELPASPKMLTASDGPADPMLVHVANHRDTAQLTHIYNEDRPTLTTVDLGADIDTMMSSLNPNTNYGAGANMSSGEQTAVASDVYRPILKFDLSGIPAGSTIVSATLILTLTEDRSDNVRTKRIFRSKRAWTEAGATWNQYDGVNNWQTAGGFGVNDCEQTDIGNTSFSASEAIPSTKSFVLTPSAIQEMLSGGSFVNNGFLLKTDTELDDAYGFGTSEHGTPTSRPKLTIEYYAPSTFSANLIATASFPIWSVAASVPGAEDAIYFGNADATSRPWHHVVLNIGTAGVYTADVIGEYWNGAWVTLPEGAASGAQHTLYPTGNEDEIFKSLGDWAINVGAMTDWATTSVNGVTGYWVRFRIVAVTVWTTTPVTSAQLPYTQRSPHVSIPAGTFAGDTFPLAMLRLRTPYGGDDDEGHSNLSKLIVGLKSRNLPDFVSHLNCGDAGNPAGWATALGTDATDVTDTLAPMGRAVNVSFGTDTALVNRLTITGTAKLASWIGTYRLLLRAQQLAGAAGDCQVAVYTRLRSTAPSDPATRTETVSLGTFSAGLELIDLGMLTIPFVPVADADEWTNVDLIFQIYVQRSAGAATLRLYDLILIPDDEWAAEYTDPFGDTAYGSDALRGNNALDIDPGLIRPRVMKSYVSGGEFQPMATWRNGGPWPKIPPAEAARLFFVMGHIKAGGTWGVGPWISTLGQHLAVEIYGSDRYLHLRP